MARKGKANETAAIWTSRTWNTKRKSTFPEALQAEDLLQTPILAVTPEPAEAFRRIAIACGAPEDVQVTVEGLPEDEAQRVAEAAVDTFNGQFSLDVQKDADEAVQAGPDEGGIEATPDAVQERMNGFRATPNQRRAGQTSAKKAAEQTGRKLRDAAAGKGEVKLSEDTLAELKAAGLI